LAKKPSMRLSQEPCFGVKTNWKRPSGRARQPALGFARDVCRVIVENDLDRGRRRVGGVEPAEEFDEFAAAMAILHQGVHLARQQIDPSMALPNRCHCLIHRFDNLETMY
jgi:hypothetical protein